MGKKNTHGGGGRGAGAKKKPPGEVKVFFSVGIKRKEIELLGGTEKVKQCFYKWCKTQINNI